MSLVGVTSMGSVTKTRLRIPVPMNEFLGATQFRWNGWLFGSRDSRSMNSRENLATFNSG